MRSEALGEEREEHEKTRYEARLSWYERLVVLAHHVVGYKMLSRVEEEGLSP